MRVASDTGGTFTDLVADDGTIAKVPSTPADPGEAVRRGVVEVALAAGVSTEAVEVLAHGTTVATNALLERRGARVALVTTTGFADVIEIARQDRPSLYDPRADRPEPLVPRHLRFEVPGRLDAHGVELEPVDHPALAEVVEEVVESGAEAVAVVLLHADLDPAHEVEVAAALRARGLDVTASHEISPEPREFERTSTAVANAYLRPRCRQYLAALSTAAPTVLVMTSAGGLVPAAGAAERPAALLLSGPAGGVAAGAAAALACGYPDAVTFDMGGTSTDVCLVLDGRPAPADEREVAGLPVRLPSLDVHTIGAGGGSIARVDEGGALVVGPASAGAVPGPACYGHGGTQPTVTDADLVAGHLGDGVALPGIGVLDRSAAESALAAAGVTAEGVLAVVDAAMVQALRRVTVEQGVDPRRLALVAFGGAGPLHACSLADALDMPCVIVPARAGVLSAVGVLAAPVRVDLVVSRAEPLAVDGVVAEAADLVARAVLRLGEVLDGEAVGATAGDEATEATEAIEAIEAGVAIETSASLDCRYQGQSHVLAVPIDPTDPGADGSWSATFHAEHRRRNGYAREEWPVEVVAVRAVAAQPAPVDVAGLPAGPRASVTGPVVVAEADCTIWVPDGWRGDPGRGGALVLRRTTG
ncbi:MAG: hydantoinase/oxoprolinase family protein [Acidimicrobiales bacterium]